MKSPLVIGFGVGDRPGQNSKSDTPSPSVSPWTSQIGPLAELEPELAGIAAEGVVADEAERLVRRRSVVLASILDRSIEVAER